ncbi:hypothetical protein FRC98_04045 [Lujinxingia vulgaris]|uniref:Uncharacterized protein n=1 Tax=Lujinxingia vulgaris TaxID=2600176 RepID=A0A5C6X9N0_9DELT|nr:hypothetical protein [Lujinxingia vulgaris]TXD38076.1 hypothetical protein FRC98_04045 [Lujinxingia vulgaris]
MDSKEWIDALRRLGKARANQLGLIVLALVAVAGLSAFLGEMSAITLLGVAVIALGLLFLAIRRRDDDTPATEPRSAFGRWLREVRRVWLASHWDLGLIAAASAGVWMLTAHVMKTYAPTFVDAIPLKILAAVAIAWVYGTAQLLAHHNTESGESTPLKDVIKLSSFRFGTVVIGVLIYAAAFDFAYIYKLLGVPEFMDVPLAIAGGLITGVMLPYVSILMVERKNPIQALQRNIDLVTGRWGLMFVFLVLTWFAFIFVALAAGALIVSAIYTVGLLTPMLVGTAAAPVALLGVLGILVAAWVLLSFYSLPVFVVFPVATYRVLTQHNEAKSPEKRAGESADAVAAL